ncbi:MAG TPA: hypothetical protein PKL84_07380, partial [Candidatus Hydrogenedentes bacterium]|nr:hypothetical protein [Candidatus Hydrogenedentota bacterium]
MRGSLCIAFAGFLAGAIVDADVVKLNDQDTLTGSVVRIVEGTLVFRTSLAGQVMAPMDTLRGLTTDANMVITLTGDKVLYGKFRNTPEGQQVVPLDGGPPAPLVLAEVAEAMPIPATAESPPEPVSAGDLDVGVETGLQWRDTSRTSTNLVVSGMMMADPKVSQPLRLFDMTWVGVPCAVAGLAYLAFASRWLLPDRGSAVGKMSDPREYTIEMLVEGGSPIVGKSIE